MTHDGRRPAILAIDTATSRVVIATGSPDGVADGISTWEAGYRHGETLLPTIGRFLGEQNIRRSRLTGIVVGTGPGAFTGLRVGIATAKGLCHGLGIPLVGVSTAEALIRAAGGQGVVLLQPAGPNDRVLSRAGVPARLLTTGESPDLGPGDRLIAVDLDGRAPAEAVLAGTAAHERLGHALIAIGAARLRSATGTGELATLVPEYVTLPRGAVDGGGEVTWSRDPR